MSVSKPFVFALVCQIVGAEEARRRLGANATGLPFNSRAAVEQSADGRTNPMVNPGAIATTSLVPGATGAEKWTFILEGLSRFAGRQLALDEEVYASASATNHVNQDLARLLERSGRIYWDTTEAVDLYTKQCSLAVSARDLAVMGAALADGGVNPVTNEQVVDAETCRYALAVMTTAGLYETSGDWLYDIGLAGKERHRRRDRHRRSGKGRARHLLTAARRCRKQRQGSARCEVPVPATWEWTSSRRNPRGDRNHRSGSLGADRLLAAAALALSGARERRPRGRDGARREVRAGRADRRAGAGVRLRREVRPDRRRPPVRRADRGLARALERHRPGEDRPCRRRSRRSLRVPPRLPGLDARTGVRLRALDEAAHRGKRSHGVRARRYRARASRDARAPVLALLHLQRVQQPARRRLGDDPAQLRRCRRSARRSTRSPSRSATARTRAPSAPTGARTSSSSSTAPIPSSTRVPARTRTSTPRRCTSAARRRPAWVATTHVDLTSSSDRTSRRSRATRALPRRPSRGSCSRAAGVSSSRRSSTARRDPT